MRAEEEEPTTFEEAFVWHGRRQTLLSENVYGFCLCLVCHGAYWPGRTRLPPFNPAAPRTVCPECVAAWNIQPRVPGPRVMCTVCKKHPVALMDKRSFCAPVCLAVDCWNEYVVRHHYVVREVGLCWLHMVPALPRDVRRLLTGHVRAALCNGGWGLLSRRWCIRDSYMWGVRKEVETFNTLWTERIAPWVHTDPIHLEWNEWVNRPAWGEQLEEAAREAFEMAAENFTFDGGFPGAPAA